MKYLGILFILLFSSSHSYGQLIGDKEMAITHLTGDFYIYTTYNFYDGIPFPSNSMYVVTEKGIVMIDTPWDPDYTKPLVDSIQKVHNMKVIMCLVTHFHDDRTAGLDILKKMGVKTYSTSMTKRLCKQRNEKQAEFVINRDTTFNFGNHSFSTYYPGAGHAPDNIVVWFDKEKILYGGCLVKSLDAEKLGNVVDANISSWMNCIKDLMKRYANAVYIIPGHEGWESTKSLKHTLKLLEIADKSPIKGLTQEKPYKN